MGTKGEAKTVNHGCFHGKRCPLPFAPRAREPGQILQLGGGFQTTLLLAHRLCPASLRGLALSVSRRLDGLESRASKPSS